MLVVIKWAVVCRTDDRRPLKQVDKNVIRWAGCDFAFDSPAKPLADHHDDNGKALVEQGGWATPESDLFSAIATKTTVRSRDPSTTAGNYCVSIQDLITIIKGLDSINTRGVTVSCEVNFEAFLHYRGGHEWPAGDDLKSLYKNCCDISAVSSRPIEVLERASDTTIVGGPSISSRIALADNIDDESDIAGGDRDGGSDNLFLNHARDNCNGNKIETLVNGSLVQRVDRSLDTCTVWSACRIRGPTNYHLGHPGMLEFVMPLDLFPSMRDSRAYAVYAVTALLKEAVQVLALTSTIARAHLEAQSKNVNQLVIFNESH
ncbi:hypothetical protein NM208_g17096 [Fusarium decemcellulare]|uniref:Uncharacterized protein n=1 Tax=Fusarium decemcellulare TaxID=57161 RepID=A0ACC1R9I8_9HYPO|nr:hypothetical protein NM208_g17096 [Fusarium decemcellulare]